MSSEILDLRKIAAAIKDLPADATIPWSDNALGEDKNFTGSWIDVYAPELCEQLQLNWLLTIDHPSGEESHTDAILKMPFNATVEMMMPAGLELGAPEKMFLIDGEHEKKLSLATFDVDEDSDPDDPNVMMTWNIYQGDDATVSEVDGRRWISCPVWSARGVSEFLNEWILRETERNDICFVFDPAIGYDGLIKPFFLED